MKVQGEKADLVTNVTRLKIKNCLTKSCIKDAIKSQISEFMEMVSEKGTIKTH
jgi:hypothetical protein